MFTRGEKCPYTTHRAPISLESIGTIKSHSILLSAWVLKRRKTTDRNFTFLLLVLLGGPKSQNATAWTESSAFFRLYSYTSQWAWWTVILKKVNLFLTLFLPLLYFPHRRNEASVRTRSEKCPYTAHSAPILLKSISTMKSRSKLLRKRLVNKNDRSNNFGITFLLLTTESGPKS